MTIQLRYYQAEALDALYNYFLTHPTGNPLIALPTGTGKSILPAAFIHGIMKKWPNQRFAMVTHVKELIQQNADELLKLWSNAPLGIYSAGLKQKDTAHNIIYGGVQSMVKHADWFGRRDIVFIDEAHLLSGDSESQYQSLLGMWKLINPSLKIVGMTATKFRMGMGLLTNNGIFTDIVYDKTDLEGFNELLNAEFMSPLIPQRTKIELDVSDVSVQQGEFVSTQLQGAVDKAEITFKALQEAIHYGKERKNWLIFASGIEHAEHIAEQLGAFGIDCAPVHSKRPSDYNDAAIKAFKNNELRAIVNYGKLTTGFNHPPIDFILMLRPTLSVPLWVQMLGRGTRPAEGKENCIAEGSLVLTNNGLIPIEKVSIYDKIWDGVEFVCHTGIIYKGFKEVIEYEGLFATSEHLVATKKGWQTFGECFKKRIRIKVTGIGRKPIREIENLFSDYKIQQAFIHRSSMYELFRNFIQGIHKRNKFKSWMQNLRNLRLFSRHSKMVNKALLCCKATLYKCKKSKLLQLWWERNTIQFPNATCNGGMDYEQFRFTQTSTYRPQRQQWSLRNWKSKILNNCRKYVKPKINKKHVFDITNAGKLNRFTVNGLLVHNCLVLDFARNTPRLGPINDPRIPNKKGAAVGETPIKICESCGAYNHISARLCCQCSEPFTFQQKLVSKSGTDELIRAAAHEPLPQIESFNVLNAVYSKHNSKSGKATLKVIYYTTGLAFTEYVCLEHSGMAGKMARDWWRKRSKLEPPATIDLALQEISRLRCPRFIRVHVNKRYPEIVSCEF